MTRIRMEQELLFSRSVVSNSASPWTAARQAGPSPTPGVYSNSYPFSQWCHPTISSSVIPFSSFLQSFPASGSFQMRQFFASGGQIIRVSASASVLPVNIQDWFPLGMTGLISLHSKALSRVFSNTTVQKYQFFSTHISIHDDWKKHSFVSKVMSLFFNMLSKFVIAFLSRGKYLNFMAAVTVYSDLGAQEEKICHCFPAFPLLFAMKWWEWMQWS